MTKVRLPIRLDPQLGWGWTRISISISISLGLATNVVRSPNHQINRSPQIRQSPPAIPATLSAKLTVWLLWQMKMLRRKNKSCADRSRKGKIIYDALFETGAPVFQLPSFVPSPLGRWITPWVMGMGRSARSQVSLKQKWNHSGRWVPHFIGWGGLRDVGPETSDHGDPKIWRIWYLWLSAF